MDTTTYKILLTGDGGVGKTTFVTRLTGMFEKTYKPTIGVEVYPLRFRTNYGLFYLNIWDCAGQEKFSGLPSTGKDADGAIVMFDVTSRITYTNVPFWVNSIKKICPLAKLTICGNKVDILEKKVHTTTSSIVAENIPYFDVSTKSKFNCDKPFLSLLREITGHTNLEFLDIPLPLPLPLLSYDLLIAAKSIFDSKL